MLSIFILLQSVSDLDRLNRVTIRILDWAIEDEPRLFFIIFTFPLANNRHLTRHSTRNRIPHIDS